MASPIECLQHLQSVHEDYTQDKDIERHRSRAGEGIRQYIQAVAVQKDMEDLI